MASEKTLSEKDLREIEKRLNDLSKEVTEFKTYLDNYDFKTYSDITAFCREYIKALEKTPGDRVLYAKVQLLAFTFFPLFVEYMERVEKQTEKAANILQAMFDKVAEEENEKPSSGLVPKVRDKSRLN